jgi:hypothetical protein
MKNWKRALIGIVVIIALGFAFVACGGGNGNDPCDCNPKAHLGIGETCNCGLNDCNCTEQTATIGGITIRKVAGITVEEMNDTVTKIELAYESLFPQEKATLAEKITGMNIVSGNTAIKDGTILKIGTGANKVEIELCFDSIVSE